ncbi:MAG: hypothetical protein JWN27_143 [Candidatus Eremiobacteraeota bacterium]|nr:hypothetical protein [Candidatus Eremiobacteraeota bacterium]
MPFSIRSIVLAALGAALVTPAVAAVPALAQDALSRQLIDQCVGCRLPKDLHGRDLHGLRFIGSDLRNVDFSRANLRGARFSGADLDGARFDDADLRDARFEGVSVHGTSFARAKLDGVKLSGADFDGHGRVGLHRAAHERGYVWIEDGEIAIPPIPLSPPLRVVPPAPPGPPPPPTPGDERESR